MMPMRKMTASSHVYPRIKARMKKETPRKTATPVMMWMKCSIYTHTHTHTHTHAIKDPV